MMQLLFAMKPAFILSLVCLLISNNDAAKILLASHLFGSHLLVQHLTGQELARRGHQVMRSIDIVGGVGCDRLLLYIVELLIHKPI